MSNRSDWLKALGDAVEARRWNSCASLLYRVLYGASAMDLLLITNRFIAKYLPIFEARWPDQTWARTLLNAPENWIQLHRRALPDAPENARNSDAQFLFSLDGLLLGWVYRDDVSVLTSACACSIREVIHALVLVNVGDEAMQQALADCGCGSAKPGSASLLDPRHPVEVARQRFWKELIDGLGRSPIMTQPDASLQQMEQDLAVWDRHGNLLIVPEAAALFT